MKNIEDRSPEELQAAMFEVLVKAGRRCNYDLKHAIDCIPASDAYLREMLVGRTKLWDTIFNGADDPKNYVNSLSRRITELEIKLEHCQRLLAENNIDVPLELW